VNCPACGSANEAGRKFCGECGTRLLAGCPTCGTQNAPGAKFCGECGTRLDGVSVSAPSGPPTSPVAAAGAAVGGATERRLVSVLFADLVGFTARSATADPEQVREFLSAYFDLSRDVVERYGGTVEKFIGDAVMAIWGAPVAHEDDAERAVRAALELVEAVRHLGRQRGDDELALRAAVMTGEAAVAVGAVGQGMVAGDLVNTASRLQGVAPSGSVLVGEATKRAAAESILFEEAGEQLLKGKEAPVPAWRALRVRGLVGAGAAETVEAPFVGRDDELRLLKDFLHASARERRVRLISVTGQAGIGKSRLARELRKYIDGITEGIFVHVGRSPSFGEGVTFWALGEMIRMRAGLAEGDDEPRTRERIAATLAEYVADEAERRRIEPALLSLLGVGEPPAGGRDALFAAWRSFFEQISLQGTTLLIFEDLQWADTGQLDFIDHLLEWSVGYPILVITLARPELIDRRPTFGAGRRNFVALALAPLSDDAMAELLTGLAPGLPAATVRAILARADGIPLYAVETIRMLVEEGRLEEAAGIYRTVGELGDLNVPETLHALIAARLDAVDPADRALLGDGSVLGQTFTIEALGALTGRPSDELEPRLRALVQRELLVIDTDPRSPERGQYGFTQALVREVAYGTLSRKDRLAKHVAAARYFESLGDEEVAGVLADHYVSAHDAATDGPERDALGAQARISLRAAGERARALGSLESATTFWERARSVTAEPSEEAELLEKIALAERDSGRFQSAEAHSREAIERWNELGDRLGAARATVTLGRTLGISGRLTEATPLLVAAEATVADLAPHPVLVELWLSIGIGTAYLGDPDAALPWLDRALADAERLRDMRLVAEGMGSKGGILATSQGRVIEGRALLEAAHALAETNGDSLVAVRALHSLSLVYMDDDPRRALTIAYQALDIASRYGYGPMRLSTLANAIEASMSVGDWDRLAADIAAVRMDELEPADRVGVAVGRIEIDSIRGEPVDELESELRAFAAGTNDPQSMAGIAVCIALARSAEGRYEDAFREALIAEQDDLNAPYGLLLAARAAIWQRDARRAREVLDRFEARGARGEAHRAIVAGSWAALALLEGDRQVAATGFRDAWARLRELGIDVALALSQLDCLAVAPPDDPLADEAAREARPILERTGAVAYLRQLDALEAERGGSTPRGARSAGSPTASQASEAAV
jgi:class 3 adenylate cyclase/predicted ATPase